MQAATASRSWLRHLRISVRGLIALVLAIGGGLGWIVHQAHVQRDAVAAIRRAGGRVRYDWEWNSATVKGSLVKPWAPRWLVELTGDDYFGHVVLVWLPPKSDAEILHVVRRLPGVEVLDIEDWSLSDAEPANLNGLTNLSRLFLYNSSVTDAGLAHLKGLTMLTELDLSRSRVTDTGLAHLKGLTGLAALDLRGTQVTDAGLAHLKGLTKLTWLDLRGTQVTETGIKQLKQVLPSLTIYR
jgi:hypothetical protein